MIFICKPLLQIWVKALKIVEDWEVKEKKFEPLRERSLELNINV